MQRALRRGGGVSFLRDRYNDSGAAAERNRKRVQEGAPVEWDIWSHRAIQQSLASAAHTNGWYRAATPSAARSSRTGFSSSSVFSSYAKTRCKSMGCEKTKDPRSVPRSLFLGFIFPSTLLARISPECLCSPLLLAAGSLLHPPPRRISSFCLVGCRGAQRHEKKESGIGPLLSSRSLHPSLSLSSTVSPSVLRLFFSPWLPRRVGLWMLSLSYLMPSTLRRQWRYQHIHSFQILPPFPLPRPLFREMSHPKRRNEHTNEVADARERGRMPVSRGFCCHCERILLVAVQIKSWLSMKSETLVYDLSSSMRRFITRSLFDKVLLQLLILCFRICLFFQIWFTTREEIIRINFKPSS